MYCDKRRVLTKMNMDLNNMDIKNRIGIIGRGFVGSAVAHGFSNQTGYSTEIRIYDKDPMRSENSLDETINNSDFIFLSVPTPATKSGKIDLSIVKKMF